MKLLQLIYTSCKKGLSSGSGFQTYSMSEGITEEEWREIERYGLYVPPTNLPTQPTKDEIETLFPVALRFFRLESGRFGICQSRYIGQDYSGRYGNYFCHALVLEQGYFPVYPIQLYRSPAFRDHLTENELALNSTPQPLPALELYEFASSPAITFEGIMEFIGNSGIEPVKEMVSAAVSYDETHRSLILSDSQANIPYWIAALQMAFPLKLAHNLTFTTYIHDPANFNFLVSAVPRTGSRFSFSETQRNFENYIFELENPGTRVMEKEYEFAKNVDMGYTISRESLEEFHNFIDLFDFDIINKELDSISDLFRMARIGVEDLPPGRILAAVEFANKYASPGVLGQLSESLHQILDNLISKVDFKSAEMIAKFLFKISRQSAEKRHLETAYTFFFRALDHLILHNPQPSLEATENFYWAIGDENITSKEEFVQRALSTHRLEQITQTITGSPGTLPTGIYFTLAAGTIISIRYTWDNMMEKRPIFKLFIQDSFKSLISSAENLTGALATASRDKDFFVSFMAYCLEHLVKSEENRMILLESYINVMKTKPTETAAHIRLNLNRLGHSYFIYDEYSHLLHEAPNKPESFWTYFNTIFRKDNLFLKEWFSQAVEEYLDLLWDKESFHECEKILDYEESITSPGVIRRVVEGFENGLPLEPPDENRRKKIQSVLEIKRKRKITTSPDVSRLIMVGIESEKARLEPGASKISTLIKPVSNAYTLEKLNMQRVTQYFNWCNPHLLRLVKSSQDHAFLFQWWANSKLDKNFVLEYTAEIQTIIKEDKKSGLDILLNYLKFYLSTLINDPQYLVVKEKNRRHIVKILARLANPQLKYIRSNVLSWASRGAGEKNEFMSILEKVAERSSKSFFKRIKRIFTKENNNTGKNKTQKLKSRR